MPRVMLAIPLSPVVVTSRCLWSSLFVHLVCKFPPPLLLLAHLATSHARFPRTSTLSVLSRTGKIVCPFALHISILENSVPVHAERVSQSGYSQHSGCKLARGTLPFAVPAKTRTYMHPEQSCNQAPYQLIPIGPPCLNEDTFLVLSFCIGLRTTSYLDQWKLPYHLSLYLSCG